jgi:FG-GAP-like repeat/ASPIC and UnbV
MAGMCWILRYCRSISAALAAGLVASAIPNLASAITFTNVTAGAGITYKQNHNIAPGALLQTGGAAAADYDNDGLVDLFVTRLDGADVLYRNLGNGTFQNVAAASGFTANLPTNGAGWADVNNDGYKDLYLTACGDTGVGDTRNYLYMNDGHGHFTEEAVQRGADIGGASRYGMSVTFGDYDGDGYLDIFTTDWGNDASVSTSRLLHNLGAANPGHFVDVTHAAGLDTYRPSHFIDGSTDSNAYRFSPIFTDLDRDGHPDLVITGDFKTSQIFWNNGNGTFTDGTAAAGMGTDEDGMGMTIGDYNNDGKQDVFISALVDVPGGTPHSGNRLFKNNGNRTFTDVTDQAGVRNSGWSWGTTFLDYDNDRDQDLVVTNGWDPNTPDQSHLYRNDNGVFTDVSNAVGVTDTKLGRGLLSFDYDNDGDPDVFIANHGSTPVLYRNDGGNANDWIEIKLQGTVSNRDAIGAFITIDPKTSVVGDEMVKEITAGSNFLSQNDLTALFGLGSGFGSIDLITIDWPSGIVEQLRNVSPDQILHLVEGVLTGDYNHDGIVDAADYTVWRDEFGSTGTGLAADGNNDNTINQLDYDIWKNNFGDTQSGAGSAAQNAPVPEPSTEPLLVVGVTVAACWYRSKSRRSTTPFRRIVSRYFNVF